MIAEIAELFGSRLAPRRSRTSVRRRPLGRRIAIESLEPRQLLAIDVAIVDNSGLASTDALLYVTGHGIPGNNLLPTGTGREQVWNSPTPELRILDTSRPTSSGKFTQAAVTIDSISVTGTTAKVTTTVPHQLQIGDSVFVSGTFGTSGSHTTIDAHFEGVTGAFTVTHVHAGTQWSVSGIDPFTGDQATDAGWFEYTVPTQTGTPTPLTLAGSAAAYLPATISTPTVTAVSADAGVVTVTLSAPANVPLNSPIFIQGLSQPGLSVTAPTLPPSTFTNVSLASTGAVVTVTTNAPHGLVPGQAISVTSSDTQYNLVSGTVLNTGLFDPRTAQNPNGLTEHQFTYSLSAAPTNLTATGTIAPTSSGAIAVSTTQLVVNLSSTAPTSGSATLAGSSEAKFNGTWVVTPIPTVAGLPDTAVWLTASGNTFTAGETGNGGTVSTGSVDLNGLQLVSQNASTNPALTANQLQYALTGASGTVPSMTGVSLSAVTVKPVAVAALPQNGQSEPIVTLDENIEDFSAQLVQMVTPAADLPFPLGITPGAAAISNLGTPPFAIGTQAGNSVADIVEFYYAGSGASDYSTFDLSGVDGFALPLTLSSSKIKPAEHGKPANVSTVGLNTALGTTREAVGTAFTLFVGNEPSDVKAKGADGADFSRLLYDAAVSRNLGTPQSAQDPPAPLPVAADLPDSVLDSVAITVATSTVAGAPTSFTFTTTGTVQSVPSSDFGQGQPWAKVAQGQIISGAGIPPNTFVQKIEAKSGGFTDVMFSASIPAGPVTNLAFEQQTGVVTATKANHGLVPGQAFSISGSGTALDNKPFTVVSTKLSDQSLSKDVFTFTYTPTTTPVFPAATTTVTAQNHGVIAWSTSNLAVQVDGSFATTPATGGTLEISGFTTPVTQIYNAQYTVGPGRASDYGLPANVVLLEVPGGATPFTLGQTADGGSATNVALPIFQAPPSVPDNQFDVIAAPKDWLIQQGASVAIDDPMAAWWDTTIDAFFKEGNYLQVAVGTPLVGNPVSQSRMYTGTYNTTTNAFDFYWSADSTKAVQFSISKPTPENITPAIAPPPSSDPSYPKYVSLANALWVWAQAAIPSGDQGLVWDQILQAFCRGVALDGVSTTEPTSTTSAASNAAWTVTANWYQERTLADFGGMTSRYCPYSKFLHFGTLDGGTDPTGTKSIYVGGLAYGFSEDEVPVGADGNGISPLGGPSKMDGTVPDGATLTLFVNPWSQAPTTVTGLDKTQGSVNGGTVVTISGTGFNAGSTVKFGTVAATNVTYNPASGGQPATLTVTSPAHAAGQVDITVTTGDSTSPIVAAGKFTYASTSKPIVYPSAAPLPTDAVTFTITGEHFSPTKAGNTVKLSSGTAIVQSATATSITLLFTSRPTAGTLTATVKTGGASSGAVQVATAYATVTPVTAPLAATAKQFVITGTGFDAKTPANNVVRLSSGAGVVTKATATALTISLTTPPQTGPLLVTSITVGFAESAPLVQVATVVPGPASARSTVTASASEAAVGTPVIVTLQARDALGNLVTTGGARVRFAASSSGKFSKVTDNRDGTYTATFTTPRIGAQVFSATVNRVKVTDTATTAFVFQSQFSQPIPGAGWSVARGPGFLTFLNTAIATGPNSNVALYTGAAARDLTVTSNVENLEDGQFGGVVARYSSKTSSYQAGLLLESGQYFAVIQAVTRNGTRTLAKQAVLDVGEGLVSFTLSGTSLSLSLNGFQVAQATDSRFQSGSVGISGGNAVGFTNFFAG